MTSTVIRRILHIDLDAFFVSAEQAFAPELRGKPVIVTGRRDYRGVVSSASYEARAFGICSGMSVKTASLLCPDAILIQGNFPRYQQISQKFMSILVDFSPHVEPRGLDEAYLDITGYAGLMGSAAQLAARMKQRINTELDLTASIGIAGCKLVAKIASELCKPDGVLEIAVGGERAFLSPLPLSKLPGVGRKTEAKIRRLGVTTIGELASLPLSAVKECLGSVGLLLYDYANGIDERRVEPPGEAKSISHQNTFAEDTLARRFLEANLYRLCELVGSDLRKRNKQARCIILKVRYADFETITRSFTTSWPTDSDEVIFNIALGLLNKALACKSKRVRLLGVAVSSLIETNQLSLPDMAGQRLASLDKTIDHIRYRYGFASIQTGRVIADLCEQFHRKERDASLCLFS